MVQALQAVLFDYGGVLAEEGFRQGLKTIARDNGHDPEVFFETGRRLIYELGYVVGESTETDFWQSLQQRFPLNEEMAQLTEKVLSRFVLRPAMLSAVDRLRRHGVLCAILSDQTDWLERLDRRDGIYRRFDRVYNSYRLGKSKVDPSLFDDVVADLGVRPSLTLFVDDDSGHVQRARSRGLQAILFESEQCTLEALEHIIGFALGSRT